GPAITARIARWLPHEDHSDTPVTRRAYLTRPKMDLSGPVALLLPTSVRVEQLLQTPGYLLAERRHRANLSPRLTRTARLYKRTIHSTSTCRSVSIQTVAPQGSG